MSETIEAVIAKKMTKDEIEWNRKTGCYPNDCCVWGSFNDVSDFLRWVSFMWSDFRKSMNTYEAANHVVRVSCNRNGCETGCYCGEFSSFVVMRKETLEELLKERDA